MMKCQRCNGSGVEPDSEIFTEWHAPSIMPVHVGIYQKQVGEYIRYSYFNGTGWCGWVESLKTAQHPNHQGLVLPDHYNMWRGFRVNQNLNTERKE